MRIGAFEVREPVPEMRDACAIVMLRPWVDVGRVGTLVLNSLQKHTGAREFARLARPGNFFDFTRYRPRTRNVGGRRVFTTPNSIAHHARHAETNRDFIFLHLREPHALGEDYAEAVAAFLRRFDVSEYCRIGGMYDSVPHTRPIRVTGTLSEAQAEAAKGVVSPSRSTYQGPTSIINLVTEIFNETGVETSSLMAHLPQYVQLDEDHMGASRLLEVLCAIYGFPKSLADPGRGQRQYLDINKAVESNSEVKGMIGQLETYYDRVLAAEEPDEDVRFSSDVERFLSEMSERLDDEDDASPRE